MSPLFLSRFVADCIEIIGEEKAAQIRGKYPRKTTMTAKGKFIGGFVTKEDAATFRAEIATAARIAAPAVFAQIAPPEHGGKRAQTRVEKLCAEKGYALPTKARQVFAPPGAESSTPAPAIETTAAPKTGMSKATEYLASRPNGKGRARQAWSKQF